MNICVLEKMTMKKLFLLILCIVHCALCFDVVAQNDREAERKVNAAVAELKRSAYEGRYTLLIYNAESELVDKQSGDITLKGNRFRLTLAGNETKYDGKTQWMYMSEYNEVSVTEPTTDELRELNPLVMIEHYVATDRIAMGENGEINFYPQTPKGSEYFKVELHLNRLNLPTRLIVHQSNGNKITIHFEELRKSSVDNSFFVFDVSKYPNVEVNDLR